jgi:hypothetical protein
MINKSGHTKKKLIIGALEQSLGVVTTACSKADIPRSTFYKWYNEDEQFKTDVDAIQEITLDFAESQLFKQIKENNTTATIFFLKTKGKNRGYIERQEIQHSGEIKEIVVNVKTAQVEDDSEH